VPTDPEVRVPTGPVVLGASVGLMELDVLELAVLALARQVGRQVVVLAVLAVLLVAVPAVLAVLAVQAVLLVAVLVVLVVLAVLLVESPVLVGEVLAAQLAAAWATILTGDTNN
jgi:hypothetical protein